MSDQASRPPVALQIEALIQPGLQLTCDALQYIESATGRTTPEKIGRFLLDVDEPEQETVLDLILFPDETLQLKIETLLADDAMDASGVALIHQDLCRHLPRAPVMLSEGAKPVLVPVDDDAWMRFLERLKLNRRLPVELTRLLRSHLDETDCLRARVMFRNAQLDCTSAHISFWDKYFAKMMAASDRYWPCLKFTLALLDEIGTVVSLENAIMAKRLRCQKHLQQLEDFEYKWARSNMETLMMQGVRMPHIDKAQLRQAIGFLDHILLVVFERPAVFDAAPRTIDLGYAKKEGLADLFKALC